MVKTIILTVLLIFFAVGSWADSQTYQTVEMLDKYMGENLGVSRTFAGQKVAYFGHQKTRDAFKLTIKDGKLYNDRGELFDTKSRKWMYVMDTKGNIYAQPQVLGTFHHSTFFAGKPVSGAGMLQVENGVLLYIDNSSGHYKPGSSILMQVVERLEQDGVKPKNVQFFYLSAAGEINSFRQRLSKVRSPDELQDLLKRREFAIKKLQMSYERDKIPAFMKKTDGLVEARVQKILKDVKTFEEFEEYMRVLREHHPVLATEFWNVEERIRHANQFLPYLERNNPNPSELLKFQRHYSLEKSKCLSTIARELAQAIH